jgi:hypothetical protein
MQNMSNIASSHEASDAVHSGCCCDTRRAVFAVNIVSICVYGLRLISLFVFAAVFKGAHFDEDAVRAATKYIDGVEFGMFLVGMVCNGVAIYGASYFNKIAIVVGGLWYVFQFVLSLVFFYVGSAIMAIAFCYPHVVFYYEMKVGIMSCETYPQEKHCCECCN